MEKSTIRRQTKECTVSTEAKGRRRHNKVQEATPHLPGAYNIRTLVKQMTCPQKTHKKEDDISFSGYGDAQTQPPAKEIKMKPARRRSQTTKPFRQRLINMAEARKEIVTALKFHRAAMKETQTETHQMEFRYKPSSETPTGIDLLRNFPGRLPSSLPSEFVTYNDKPIDIAPPSSLPNFVPRGRSISTAAVCDQTAAKPPDCCRSSQTCVSTMNHTVDDDEEMGSIGEQHELLWSDAMNLVHSAWWMRFLNSLEVHEEAQEGKMDGLFGEFMEIPTWLNGSGNRDRSTQIASPSDDNNYQDFLRDGS